MDFIAKDRLVPLDSEAILLRADSNVDEVRVGARPSPIRCAVDSDDEASGDRFDLDFPTLTVDVEAKPHGPLPQAVPFAPRAPTSRPRAARSGTSPRGPPDRSRPEPQQSRQRVPPTGRGSEGGPRSASPRPSSSTGPRGRTLASGGVRGETEGSSVRLESRRPRCFVAFAGSFPLGSECGRSVLRSAGRSTVGRPSP